MATILVSSCLVTAAVASDRDLTVGAPPFRAGTPAPVDAAVQAAARSELFRPIATAVIAIGCLGGGAKNAFFDHPTGEWNFADEQWFGEHTYVGGADKASHFVAFEILARELAEVYEFIGYEQDRARYMGFGLSIATGALIEIGDGTNQFGFSYEDLVMDIAGAGTALFLAKTGNEDLLGFRYGKVPGPVPEAVMSGIGRDYSYEIYTGDLKLAGVASRLGVDIGMARYLLLSVTYGVKGYPRGAIADRERQVGFEIGLNLGEMLSAVHVDRDTWWGLAAHAVLDNFRVPYTAGGYRYDLNHHDWRGPNTGEGCGACR